MCGLSTQVLVVKGDLPRGEGERWIFLGRMEEKAWGQPGCFAMHGQQRGEAAQLVEVEAKGRWWIMTLLNLDEEEEGRSAGLLLGWKEGGG